MEAYIWLGLVLVLIVIEAATVSLTTIWLAAGSLVSFILAMLKLPIWVQITCFLAVSVVLLVFTRPLAVKYLKVRGQKTNADALIGEKGIVINDITEHNAGQVKVKGQVWTAVSTTGETLEKDTEVFIKDIQGVKLVVEKIQKVND
ncbi:MAG: NfeD family protein [Clostridiaceae bacterium]|nr:NfeD family protein [Clostridiaceae bacterium]